ncbi:unnamed protein product [Prunus armeniaca]|uniref:Uncharacterized protein n=1 Tax=Prunus armeniaca TaxID=36596 RepID=A0A6J5UR32_PRUAR|nr:unnamed protein product [Prunus armeniaca]CAB4308956.1 unnamed protein product [Prunus armeniaca]
MKKKGNNHSILTFAERRHTNSSQSSRSPAPLPNGKVRAALELPSLRILSRPSCRPSSKPSIRSY